MSPGERLLVSLILLTSLGLGYGYSLTRVSIKVLPQVVQRGQAIRVTCSVPRHPQNRGLMIALPEYTSHYVQLDGDQAPVTNRIIFDQVPCGVPEAVCAVGAVDGQFVASLPVEVAGCESAR